MIEIPAYKAELRNTWSASFYYTDWQGKRRLKKKRGFQRKKDAQAFEEEFLRPRARSCDMTFRSFAEIYLGDMEPRLKMSDSDVRRILQEEVFRHEIVEGPQAEDARRDVDAANARMQAAQKERRK